MKMALCPATSGSWQVLKVLGDGGSGEGPSFKKGLPPKMHFHKKSKYNYSAVSRFIPYPLRQTSASFLLRSAPQCFTLNVPIAYGERQHRGRQRTYQTGQSEGAAQPLSNRGHGFGYYTGREPVFPRGPFWMCATRKPCSWSLTGLPAKLHLI